MINNNDLEVQSVNGWVFRQRMPDGFAYGPGPYPVILMLHGWTGDENSMWIFAERLPKNALLIAPRGLYPAARGGFSWVQDKGRWPQLDDFKPAAQALWEFVTAENFPAADLNRLYLAGFSMGAALAFSMTLLYPQRVGAAAALSGFLPDGVAALVEQQPLKRKPVFLAHGSRDDLVPVERARQAVELLRQAGAQVDYCEDDVGHRLSVTCFRSLGMFFEDVIE